MVGLLVVAAMTSLTWFIMSTSKDKYDDASTYRIYANFSDASGIRWKTRVQINGIDVGKIGKIEHIRTKNGLYVAKVSIKLLKSYTIYKDASIKKAAESLLGDYRLDLVPGNPATGVLPPNETIQNVQSVADMEAIQSELKHVARNVSKITESFSRVLSGPEAEGSLEAIMKRVENSLGAIEKASQLISGSIERNDNNVDEILSNLHSITKEVAQATTQQGDLGLISNNLAKLSGHLESLTSRVSESLLGEPGTPTVETPIRQSIEQLNETISHLNSIVRKVDHGVGTVGRLVNDSSVVDGVEDTINNTNELLGGFSRIQTDIELRTEYGVPFGEPNEEIYSSLKSTLGVIIRPRPDKSYIFEATADPRGRSRREIRTETSDGITSKTELNNISFNDLKFSAQFAKRYYFATLRFGIIENTGGVGLNLHALSDNLELRFDIFDFERRNPDSNINIFPRLRTTLMVEFFNHLWFQGGLDDPLNSKLRTWFMGGVLRFTDDDLKTILSVVPSP